MEEKYSQTLHMYMLLLRFRNPQDLETIFLSPSIFWWPQVCVVAESVGLAAWGLSPKHIAPTGGNVASSPQMFLTISQGPEGSAV